MHEAGSRHQATSHECSLSANINVHIKHRSVNGMNEKGNDIQNTTLASKIKSQRASMENTVAKEELDKKSIMLSDNTMSTSFERKSKGGDVIATKSNNTSSAVSFHSFPNGLSANESCTSFTVAAAKAANLVSNMSE